MRIMMISENDLSSKESLGVTKKLKGQYKAFRNLGHEVYHLCLDKGNGVLLEDDATRIVVPAKRKSYFTVVSLFLSATRLCEEHRIDMCYVRYPLADWVFMRMVKGLHRVCRVVVEIPTYPYDEQNKSIRNIVANINGLQDRCFRKLMYKYVDYIVTFSNDQSIFEIPCINIANGIDVSQVHYLGDKLTYGDDINLIGVARLQRDHGYDRVIKGMREYYDTLIQQRKITLHIVGTGDAEAELRKLVIENKLEDRVLFYGVKTGKELEDIYLKCQIGISFLAGYRSGLTSISALKNCEYCAVGIPFIGSCSDPSIPSDVEWFQMQTNDESPIDMSSIIRFNDYIRRNEGIHIQMRQFAESQMSWEHQLERVLSINE